MQSRVEGVEGACMQRVESVRGMIEIQSRELIRRIRSGMMRVIRVTCICRVETVRLCTATISLQADTCEFHPI